VRALVAPEPDTPTPAAPEQRPLGRILIDDGLIDAAELERALAFQQSYGGRLGGILLRFGALPEDRLLDALGRQLAMPIVHPDEIPQDQAAFAAAIEKSGYPAEWWVDQEALPWLDDVGTLHCVARDPLATSLQEFVADVFGGFPVCWYLAANRDLDRALDALSRAVKSSGTRILDEVSHLRELAEEAPVVELVQSLLSQSFNERASDLHVEPEERSFHVRFRIDGVLQNRLTLPRERFDAIASRIKLISGMDIAERRLPQDGRLSVRIGGEEVDVRVSALPGSWGESLVLRLLPKRRSGFRLSSLGMAGDDLERFRAVAHEPHGITLVTGPTGSGKSTTLYATLEEINDGTSKIVTVEEPVEYNIQGITQVHAQAEIGYTFARALRAILRQDPDKIMIGEIRDLETAEIAVQAALTGHMVFSTLHTNDAVSSFTRLIDMGIEPFLVASSVKAVMAQRLVRRLCPVCSVPDPTPDGFATGLLLALPWIGPGRAGSNLPVPNRPGGLGRPGLSHPHPALAGPENWHKPVGCNACFGTGYKGRLGIYELVMVTPDLHDFILRRAPSGEIATAARGHGYRSLREDGLLKARRGETSIEEVLRVTGLNS
jgi:general secretion pathway protein E